MSWVNRFAACHPELMQCNYRVFVSKNIPTLISLVRGVPDTSDKVDYIASP
jgi:hypothetical protein